MIDNFIFKRVLTFELEESPYTVKEEQKGRDLNAHMAWIYAWCLKVGSLIDWNFVNVTMIYRQNYQERQKIHLWKFKLIRTLSTFWRRCFHQEYKIHPSEVTAGTNCISGCSIHKHRHHENWISKSRKRRSVEIQFCLPCLEINENNYTLFCKILLPLHTFKRHSFQTEITSLFWSRS